MNDNTNNPFTLFDNLLQNSQLQTMKLLLPFLPAANQKMMVLLIKFLELKYTMEFFRKGNVLNICSASDENASPIDKIAAMKDYLPKKEQETIDNIINMMSAMELFQSMSGEDGSPFPFSMDFFSNDDDDDSEDACETDESDTTHTCETGEPDTAPTCKTDEPDTTQDCDAFDSNTMHACEASESDTLHACEASKADIMRSCEMPSDITEEKPPLEESTKPNIISINPNIHF